MPRHRSSSDYVAIGSRIATDHIQHGTNLTQALKKAAIDEDLGVHQIERVAEHANHKVFKDTFEKRGSGDLQFEPASSEEVIKDLNMPAKVAFDLSDYYSDPERPTKVAMADVIADNFGESLSNILPELEKTAALEETRFSMPEAAQTLEDFEKVASSFAPTAQFDESNIFDMVTKLSATVHHFDTERLRIKDLAGQEREKFAELMQETVKAGYNIEDLYKAATIIRPDQKDSLRSLFAWVISDMDKKACFGIPKSAAPVDPKMISDRLDKFTPPHGVTVINGSHPVTLAVNMIADLATQWDDANKGHAIAQKALEKARQVQTSITPRKGSYTGQSIRGI